MMARGGHVLAATLTTLLVVSPASSGWLDVERADADLDLTAAQQLGLATVAESANSADAVAVASWWLRSLEHLPEPEAILSAPGGPRDPELGFVLARVAGKLGSRPPAGTLATVELAGPFGRFDTLDLLRDVVPPDDQLPPLGTRWSGSAQPFRLHLRSADGWVGPPEVMAVSGVYLAAWSVVAESPVSGWLVVEANASVNLSLDGSELARLRECGVVDPAVTWYRVELDPGAHRIRVEMASRGVPKVRVSLVDGSGSPVDSIRSGGAAPWAASRARAAPPPAAAAVAEHVAHADTDVSTLLVAAAVARGRGDPGRERRLLERALERAPDDPWVHLRLARLFLSESTGAATEVDFRHSREHLRACRAIPLSLLVERLLAHRQQRGEDRDRLLDELVEGHGDDARVLMAWVREAVRRGWVREAEDGLGKLQALLPASHRVAELRLEVLEGLERWEERNRVLLALAETTPARVDRVEQLASDCFGEEALAVLDRLRERVDDPALDLAAIRLLMESGQREEALAALVRARQRWGELNALDQLQVVLAAHDGEELDAVLAAALERSPADLALRTLAWRRGTEPFFEPFRVDALELAAAREADVDDVDAVLILDQAVERIFADGSSIYYYHGLTRALTPAGARQAARLQQMDDATLLQVRIVKPNGRVVVPDELTAGGGNIELDDVETGDLVEEEYVAAVAGARGGHLSPYVYRFADSERAFGLSEYALLIPPGIDLQVDGRFEGLERQQREAGALSVLQWRAESVPPVPPEPHAPLEQELLPWVTYGFGVSWEDVGDAMRDQVLPVLRTSPELDAWSAQVREGDDPEAVLKGLVSALCDEVDAGRATVDPRYSAGESFSLRRGNRLGITAAVLAEAGWDVDMVLTRPLELSGSHLAVPSMEAFFIPLLRVTHDGRTVWLDLDEERRGVGHIDPAVQGSDGLVVPLSDPGRAVTYLERLPEFPNPDLEERMVVRAQVDAAGNARVQFEMALRGAQAERMLEQVRSVPSDRVAMVYRQLAASLFRGAEDVRGDLERQDEGAVLSLEMEVPGACEVAEDTMTCRSLVLSKPLAPALASLPQRRFPLVLRLPVLQRLELEIELPAGWVIDRAPRRIEAVWGEVDEELEVDGRRVLSTLYLRLGAQVVDPESYPEFVRFCHAVDELGSRPPVAQRESP